LTHIKKPDELQARRAALTGNGLPPALAATLPPLMQVNTRGAEIF
jgi:hypothetical protein